MAKTRYEKIKELSIREIAEEIVKHDITDDYCKSDCEDIDGCYHDVQCCIRWLNEVEL